MIESIPTEQRILDSAQRLLQTRGYNGFSYSNIADEVKIKTSSIHYHFSTKQKLVEELFDRYMTNFFDRLEDIRIRHDGSLDRLKAICDIFEDTADSRKFCVCGSLAVVLYAIPESVNAKVKLFMTKTEGWIQQVLDEGIENGEVVVQTSTKEHAAVFFAALEGALMLSHAIEGGIDNFRTTTNGLLTTVKA